MTPRTAVLSSIATLAIFAGCTTEKDPLDAAAMQASRVGTYVGETDRAQTSAGLDAGSRVAEEFYFVAKYQATQEQRAQAATVAKRVAPKVQAKRKQQAAAKPSTKKAASKPTKYIAIPTKSDSRAKTKTSVMLWDTEAQEIVGNNVYDLNAAPPSGTVVKFETYSAEFVAAAGG